MPRRFTSVNIISAPARPRRSPSRLISIPALPLSSWSTEPSTCAAADRGIVPLALSMKFNPL